MLERENKKSRRILHPNAFFHIYNRGNHKKKIFHSPKDYEVFLGLLCKYLDIYKPLHLFSYCLMPNHYHLLLKTGSNQDDLIKFMHRFMTSYAIYFNKKYQQTGHLFQSRYKSKYLPLDRDVRRTLEYIKKNPIEAKLCRRSKDYKWLWCSELVFISFEKALVERKMELSRF
jgi:putative transposase